MKIKFKKDYILVVSETLVYCIGFIGGVGKRAKGAALFPFILVKSDEYVADWLINHERIHFRQQIETLFIGFFVLTLIERLYARLVLKKTRFEAYLWGSGEQEAYINQNNPDYLKTRTFWTQFKYLKNKKAITLPEPGKVTLG